MSYALLDRYRVELTYDGEPRTVFPEQKDIALRYAQESGQKWFRVRVADSLVLTGEDFDWLIAIEDSREGCALLGIKIYEKMPGGSEEVRFDGEVILDESTFDRSRCEVLLSVASALDENPLASIWEKEFNLLGGTPKKTIYTSFASVPTGVESSFEVIETEEVINLPGPFWANPDFPAVADGWMLEADDVSVFDYSGPEDFKARRRTRWVREIASNAWDGSATPPGDQTIGGHGWLKVEVSGSFWRWARVVETFEILALTTSETVLSGVGLGQTFFTAYHREFSIFSRIGSIDNQVALGDCLAKFVEGLGLTVKSKYFSINDTFPETDAPYDVPFYRDFLVGDKSDWRRYSASENATRSLVTPKRFFEQLAITHNCFPVVEGDVLRVEHASYFEAQQGLDLVVDHPASIEGLYKYKYLRADFETFITWGQLEQTYDYVEKLNAGQSDFGQTYWDMRGQDCRQRKIEKVAIADFVSCDVQRIVANPEGYTDTGIVFVACARHSGHLLPHVLSNPDVGFTEGRVNALMSPYQLALRHHRHSMAWPAFEVVIKAQAGLPEIPNLEFQAYSVRPYREQVPITVFLPTVTDFNPWQLIRTQLGWGEVSEAEYSLLLGLLEVTTRHTKP